MEDKIIRIIQHDNKHDIEKAEFFINEIKIEIDNRILKKLNRQNQKSK